MAILKEGKAFDINKVNMKKERPIDVLKKRKMQKNPYETNLEDIWRLESLLKEATTHH